MDFGATEHVILKNIKLVLEIMIKNKHMKSKELCLAKKSNPLIRNNRTCNHLHMAYTLPCRATIQPSVLDTRNSIIGLV